MWQLNRITYLYFIRTVIHFSYVMFLEFRLINVHLFDILPAVSSRKVGDFFYLGPDVLVTLLIVSFVVSTVYE